MKYLSSLALASLATAVSTPRAAVVSEGKLSAKALYSITNQPSGNQVRALPLNYDGTIANAGTLTSTGGLGMRAPGPGTTDSLNSQSQLIRVGNLLYTINPGSNSVSVLAINPKNPTQLTLVGEPVSSLGDFPMSIDVHPATKQACVANSGTRSGLTCYTINTDGTLTAPLFKALPLYPTQTTPPHGSGNAVSAVQFSPDGSSVYVTVKGNVGQPTGYFATFSLAKGFAASNLVKTNVTGAVKLFGFINMPNPSNQVFFTDPTFGAGVLQIEADGTATTLSMTDIPHQGTTCWAVYNTVTDIIYTADDGANQIAAFNSTTGKLLHISELKNGNPQNFEMASAGRQVYALSEGNATYPQHIVTMQTNGAKVHSIQNFQLPDSDYNLEGLAVYV